jgi:LmbE family N-acetylglucosaminyl deacetylase
MVIAPHADDETLGCGATVALMCARGLPVRIVIATDGAASARSAVITPAQLAGIRRAEAIASAKILGLGEDDIVFLDFPDGQLENHIPAVAGALCEQIRLYAPVRVFSPYGDDGHPDHRAVAAAVDLLCQTDKVTCPVYRYPIWFWPHRALQHLAQPWRLKHLRRLRTDPFVAKKREAMVAYRSQRQSLTGETEWFTLSDRYLERFFRPYELYFERPRPVGAVTDSRAVQ